MTRIKRIFADFSTGLIIRVDPQHPRHPRSILPIPVCPPSYDCWPYIRPYAYEVLTYSPPGDIIHNVENNLGKLHCDLQESASEGTFIKIRLLY